MADFDRQEGSAARFFAILPCALWGLAFPAIKIGYERFGISADDTGGQLLFAGVRFFLAGVLAWAIGSAIYRKPLLPKRSSLWKVGVLSLLQTAVQYFFFYIGLSHTTGVKASILTASNVFIAFFVSAVLFRQDKMSARKWIGVVVGFLGVVVINLGDGFDLSFTMLGEGFIFLSAVASAFSSVCIKKFSEDELAFTLSAFQFMLGGVLLSVAGILVRGMGVRSGGFFAAEMDGAARTVWLFSDVLPQYRLSAVGILVLLAGISAVAYSLWGVLLNRFEVSKITIFGFLIPVFGVLFSSLFLNEWADFNPVQVIISLLLVGFGTYLVQRGRGTG